MSDHHPLDRHLYYGQQSLLPAECERFRIELGWRSDADGMLVALERHAMPTRELLEMELLGFPATQIHRTELLSMVGKRAETWIESCLARSNGFDPF